MIYLLIAILILFALLGAPLFTIIIAAAMTGFYLSVILAIK